MYSLILGTEEFILVDDFLIVVNIINILLLVPAIYTQRKIMEYFQKNKTENIDSCQIFIV